jgi:hypothetical protein
MRCPELPSLPSQDEVKFDREISYTNESGADGLKMRVEVVVSWNDSRGIHQSKLETFLSK